MGENKMAHNDFENRAIRAAREQLKKYSWYCGVCVDSLSSGRKYEEADFNDIVDELIMDTIYWDAPKS
jgi:hypothetical protein